MGKVQTGNGIFSYILSDLKFPEGNIVRIANSKIKHIAKTEGFYDLENEKPEISASHCFSNVDDLRLYYSNDFVFTNYGELKYQLHSLAQTDNAFYRETYALSCSQKLKQEVSCEFKESARIDLKRFDIKKSYFCDWDAPKYSLQLKASKRTVEESYISVLLCEKCIKVIYPYENN